MRTVMETLVSLSLTPPGFSASELATQVRAPSGQSQAEYGPRHAAYDLQQLRGKGLVQRKGVPRRYESSAQGLRAMVACIVLREKVMKPLLAGSFPVKRGRPQRRIPRSTGMTIPFNGECKGSWRNQVSRPNAPMDKNFADPRSLSGTYNM